MPKKSKEKKGYFYDKEEQSIINYIKAETLTEKNKIYNSVLHPALTKMIESIIRRYKLYVPDEEFTQTFNDTISYLLTKINNFNPDKGTKAYSYCGTVCKNYLIYKNMQYSKNTQRNISYDYMKNEINNDYRFTEELNNTYDEAEILIKKISSEINDMISEPEKFNLNPDEVKVGVALRDLLENWESVLECDNESNKLQKSKILYFLREETMMTTKEIRDNMKKYKCVYYLIKDKMNNE